MNDIGNFSKTKEEGKAQNAIIDALHEKGNVEIKKTKLKLLVQQFILIGFFFV